jgi:hypothetical protein
MGLKKNRIVSWYSAICMPVRRVVFNCPDLKDNSAGGEGLEIHKSGEITRNI